MSDNQEYWLENIDTDRSNPGGYVLNGKDRAYCVTGESQGSLKKSELRSRIANDRLQELPQRVQDFFDDLALIEYSDTDFLSESEKKDLWDSVLSVGTHSSKIRGFSIDHALPRPKEKSEEYKFGVGLGTLLRGPSSDSSDESTKIDLVWGFIIGLYAQRPEDHEQESDRVDTLFSELTKKAEHRYQRLSNRAAKKEIREENLDQLHEQILDIFNQEGIETDYVPFNIWEAHKYQLINGEEELKEKIIDEINLDVLKKTSRLKKAVKIDGNNVLDDYYKGDEAKPIINELWLISQTNNGAIQPKNINSLSSRNTGMKIINQYKSTDMHDDSVHFPAIEEISTGYRLTSYGKLVSYCFFENNKNCNWIEQFSLFRTENPYLGRKNELSKQKKGLVQDALDEVDTTNI
jgi:hypothetical protein